MPQLQPTTSPKLGIKLVEANASGQVARLNEGLSFLDILVLGLVKDKDLTAPPGSPASGDTYIVAASPTGAWAGQAKNIAAYINSAWVFFVPKKGWTFHVEDESKDYQFDATNWVEKTSNVTTAPTWTAVTKTASFTVSLSEAAVYLVDATSGNIIITIIAASTMGSRGFIFKRIDSSTNTVTIDPNASETIDGQSTITLNAQYDSITIVSSGTALYIL